MQEMPYPIHWENRNTLQSEAMPTGQNHDTIPACKHFNGKDHDFNRDAKFTLIDQIRNSKTIVEKQTIILQKENFWITTLRTLTPLGFNQEP